MAPAMGFAARQNLRLPLRPHWCQGTAPLHPERIPYFLANCMTPSPRQYPLSAYRSQIRSCNTATGQLRPASRLRVVESMRT